MMVIKLLDKNNALIKEVVRAEPYEVVVCAEYKDGLGNHAYYYLTQADDESQTLTYREVSRIIRIKDPPVKERTKELVE